MTYTFVWPKITMHFWQAAFFMQLVWLASRTSFSFLARRLSIFRSATVDQSQNQQNLRVSFLRISLFLWINALTNAINSQNFLINYSNELRLYFVICVESLVYWISFKKWGFCSVVHL